MDFDEAIKKHAEWKIKFRSAITKQETMDQATIAKDNCCQLGQWLYGEGKKIFGDRTEFKTVVDHHKNFHVEAGKIAGLINAKKFNEAEKALSNGTPYATISGSVGVALMALKKKANS